MDNPVFSFSENWFGKELRGASNPSQCPKFYHWPKLEKCHSWGQTRFRASRKWSKQLALTNILSDNFFSGWMFSAASTSVNSPHFRQVNISLQQGHEKQVHCESFYLRQFFIIGLHGTDSSCYWCVIR